MHFRSRTLKNRMQKRRSSLRRSRIIRTCWISCGSQSCVRAEAAIAESPNAANYDEAKANPYPELPEILKTATGETVDTSEAWWKKRRPEIVELLEREVYGRIPENVPAVNWEVRQTREVDAGGKPAIQQEIVGVVDNSACPEIKVNISMSLTLPKDAQGTGACAHELRLVAV